MIARTLMVGLLALLPGIAQATVYECIVNTTDNNEGVFGDNYFLDVDDDANTMTVYDGLIELFNEGQPMKAGIAKNNAAQLAFGWSVKIHNGRGQRTKMEFRAAYFRETSEFSLTAQPHGYTNKFHARGTCALAK